MIKILFVCHGITAWQRYQTCPSLDLSLLFVAALFIGNRWYILREQLEEYLAALARSEEEGQVQIWGWTALEAIKGGAGIIPAPKVLYAA